ncbi:uncharacterized protein KY384_003348 [Bacidia gigantensis]|uniref:uncharacterized protein n=1 Tax=Bacidia gigantensis TaxID=2732470 RepID=UPI001D03D6C4|nr:uncharacterized protein KY384_003348 [Bacidia gigantensis]KAG8531716.1 hypothetical protein KY384_003348 [Bacidia gigantensis]
MAPPSSQPTFEYCLTYIPVKTDVKRFLEKVFNRPYDLDEIKVPGAAARLSLPGPETSCLPKAGKERTMDLLFRARIDG